MKPQVRLDCSAPAFPRSHRMTLNPFLARNNAVEHPTIPAPTMATSYSSRRLWLIISLLTSRNRRSKATLCPKNFNQAKPYLTCNQILHATLIHPLVFDIAFEPIKPLQINGRPCYVPIRCHAARFSFRPVANACQRVLRSSEERGEWSRCGRPAGFFRHPPLVTAHPPARIAKFGSAFEEIPE